MPKNSVAKPTKPVKKDVPQEPEDILPQLPREVKYPKLGQAWWVGDKAITIQRAKEVLLWEDEDQYCKRVTAENEEGGEGKSTEYGSLYLLKDTYGKKVLCLANAHNRPFEMSRALSYAQDILTKCWADSRWAGLDESGMTLETTNGEPLIIDRYGVVRSGQHRLIGLILAGQLWDKAPEKWPLWDKEPSIESLVVFGISDSQKVIRTIDTALPRSLADSFYTSLLFDGKEPGERRELSKMLDNAVDLLWKRVRAGGSGKSRIYQTHSTSGEFLDRHHRLKEAVDCIHKLNKERVLSNLKLSAGQCSTLLYLMAASKSDMDSYNLADPHPSEEQLSFDNWPKAEKFWTLLAKSKKEMDPLQEVLLKLADQEDLEGDDARGVQRRAAVVRAWRLFYDKDEMTQEMIHPDPIKGKDDRFHMPDWPDCGGIDQGDAKPEGAQLGGAPPSAEEVTNGATEVRHQNGHKRLEEMQDLIDQGMSEAEAEKKLREQVDANPSQTMRKGKTGTGNPVRKAPGEVTSPTKVVFDSQGKPPIPAELGGGMPAGGKPAKAPPAPTKGDNGDPEVPDSQLTRKQLQAKRTREAAEKDRMEQETQDNTAKEDVSDPTETKPAKKPHQRKMTSRGVR